ncbi:MAG: hypothetical protein VYD05_15015 [Planctomycetota bacterium]|nr:hypothetical protein [Planctomycetota bacterium]
MTRLAMICSLRSGATFAALALATGCSTLDNTPDLAVNPRLYVDVDYASAAPGDVDVFVAPTLDLRDAAALPAHDGGYPIRYGGDEFWLRPVAVMVGDVLVRELRHSDIFGAVVERAGPETVIMKPSLVAFTVGAQEGMAGSMAFAEVGLRVEVLGPVGDGGARPLWHDQVYANRQQTQHELRPVSPYLLVGRALQTTMSSALRALDGSYVARSHVPVDTPPLGDPAARPLGR